MLGRMLSWWREAHLQIYMLHVAKMEALDDVVRLLNDVSHNLTGDFKASANMLQNAPEQHNQ